MYLKGNFTYEIEQLQSKLSFLQKTKNINFFIAQEERNRTLNAKHGKMLLPAGLAMMYTIIPSFNE